MLGALGSTVTGVTGATGSLVGGATKGVGSAVSSVGDTTSSTVTGAGSTTSGLLGAANGALGSVAGAAGKRHLLQGAAHGHVVAYNTAFQLACDGRPVTICLLGSLAHNCRHGLTYRCCWCQRMGQYVGSVIAGIP